MLAIFNHPLGTNLALHVFYLKCLLCFFRNITDENSRNLSCYCLPLLLSHELNSLEPRLKLSSTLMTVAQYNSVNEKYIYLIVPHKYLINQVSLTLINDYSLWKRFLEIIHIQNEQRISARRLAFFLKLLLTCF